MTAFQRLMALAALKATVSLATLLATFPRNKDTLSNLAVGKSVTLKAGADSHKVTRVSADTYTMEKVATAGAADVEAAKKKLLADISRAMTMTQNAVSKGDATAKQYQATMQSLRAAVNDCTTMAQVQKVRDQMNEAQASRRSTSGIGAKAGDRVKVIDEFYSGLEGKLVKLGARPGDPSEIKLDNGKTIKTSLWYNLEH